MLSTKEKEKILSMSGKELTMKLCGFFLEHKISKEKMAEALDFWRSNQKNDLYDEAVRLFGQE